MTLPKASEEDSNSRLFVMKPGSISAYLEKCFRRMTAKPSVRFPRSLIFTPGTLKKIGMAHMQSYFIVSPQTELSHENGTPKLPHNHLEPSDGKVVRDTITDHVLNDAFLDDAVPDAYSQDTTDMLS